MRLSLAALLLAACFDPTYTDATRCGAGGECPPGRTCRQQVCVLPGGGADAAPMPDGPGVDAGGQAPFSLSFLAEPGVVRGMSTNLGVTVTRTAPFTGPITVTLLDLPNGVTAPTTTITGNSGGVPITAAADATLGLTDVQLQATGGGKTIVLPLVLQVADPPGTLDVGFNGGSVLLKPFGDGDYDPSGLAVSPVGTVAVAIDAVLADTRETALVQLTGDGATDVGFGAPAGQVVIKDYEAVAIAFQPDGKLVVGGFGNTDGVTFLRFTGVGVLDTSFGPANSPGSASDTRMTLMTAMVAQSDGALVYTGSHLGVAVTCRLLASGVLDGQFASGLGCWTPSSASSSLEALAVGSEDKLYIGGMTVNNGLFTALLTSTGVSVTETAISSSSDVAGAVTVSAGQPLVVGQHQAGPGASALLARARADGTGADSSFGGGIVITSLGATMFAALTAAATQADGKIVVAGYRRDTGASQSGAMCARFTATGTLDTAFGTGGVVDLPGDGSNFLAIQPDGRIVVEGHSADGSAYVARIWP